MIESKSRFARRIGKSVDWVCSYCRRGIIPVNDRGYVQVEAAIAALRRRRSRGRPALPPSEQIIRVRVYVRRRQKRFIKQTARELRMSPARDS